MDFLFKIMFAKNVMLIVEIVKDQDLMIVFRVILELILTVYILLVIGIVIHHV